MADNCEAPKEVGKKIGNSDLSSADKAVASKMLEDTLPYKLPRMSSEDRTNCLPGDLALDHFMFSGGKDTNKFASTLNVPEDKVRSPKDITHVVLDADGGGYDHSHKAQEALQTADPSIKDSSILNLWLPQKRAEQFEPEHAVLQNLKDRDQVTESHNYMTLLNKNLGTATEFSKSVIADGGKPPTYVMPIVLNPYHLALDAEDAKSPFAITPKELGIKPITDADIDDPKYKESIVEGLKSLADSGDYRAKSVLDSVTSMNKLADTGSKIFLSSSNNDTLELATFLSDSHDNIFSATSTDRHGKPVDFNVKTAKFSEVRGTGSLLAVSPELEKNIDKTDMPHAIFHEPFVPNRLAGKEVEKAKITEPELTRLLQGIKKFQPAENYYQTGYNFNHGHGSFKYTGEPSMMESVVASWSTFEKINEAAGNVIDLSKVKSDEDKIALVGETMKDGSLVTKLETASQKLVRDELVSLGFNVPEKSDGHPADRYKAATDLMFEQTIALEQLAKSKFFTIPQVKRLREAIGLPTDGTEPKTDAFIYSPNNLSGSRVDTYLKAKTLDGKIVALPFEYGNSFGAPSAAGLHNKLSRKPQ